jgi:Domain of unknown function (DUF4345)
MVHTAEKRLFKLIVGILVCIPIVTGFIGMFFNDAFFPIPVVLPEPEFSLLDNEWRFMSAIWFAIGLCFAWMLPQLEKYLQTFQILLGLVVVGGIGRAISWGLHGQPSIELIAFTLIELIVCPLLILWLRRIVPENAGHD